MTDLVDDNPHRVLLGLPKPAEHLDVKGVFFYPDPRFFMKRDKVGIHRAEMHTEVLAELATVHPGVAHLVCFPVDYLWLLEEMEPAAQAVGLSLTSFRVFEGAAGETTLRLRKHLASLGIAFKPIRNLRAVSYLNIHKFVSDTEKRFSCVGIDSHATLGVTPHKDPTFQELVQKRRRDAWP